MKNDFNEDRILTILNDIILGLHHIHQRKLAHRSLRLDNILVTYDLKYKIANFGNSITEEDINDLYGAELSEDIEANTDIDYRSPEQLDLIPGFPVGIQVDMWGLGCLLYELVYKSHPFANNSDSQLKGKFSQVDSMSPL